MLLIGLLLFFEDFTDPQSVKILLFVLVIIILRVTYNIGFL